MIRSLVLETPENSLPPIYQGRTQEDICDLEESLPPNHAGIVTSDLHLQAVRNKFLLFISHQPVYFVESKPPTGQLMPEARVLKKWIFSKGMGVHLTEFETQAWPQ